jgi:hypothetical protein
MEHPSTTEGITITCWETGTQRCLRWRYAAPGKPTRVFHVSVCDGRPDLFTFVAGSDLVAGLGAVLPVELPRFLAGEGPPEPPIEVGTRVRHPRVEKPGEVLCVDGDFVWVRWSYGGRGTVPLSDLTVVDDQL